ncbi:MAG: haloalkane dehalogenase, partial [Pseudomonadota bacterium]
PAAPAQRAAWESLERFEKPVLTCFADGDKILGGLDFILQTRIPGAKGQPHFTTPNAAHFFQEDAPELLATRLADFMGR